jgi:hypothetical protein
MGTRRPRRGGFGVPLWLCLAGLSGARGSMEGYNQTIQPRSVLWIVRYESGSEGHLAVSYYRALRIR